MAHSIIAPSAAYIWGKPGGCTAYPLMAAAYPETEESEASREGTATHELAEKMIEAGSARDFSHLVDTPASNGHIIDLDMLAGAEMYARDVLGISEQTGSRAAVEVHTKAPAIHDLSAGTPDAYLYDVARQVLYVWDFKYGREMVEAFENWQAINYVCGILDRFGIDGRLDQILTVKIRIVQPRAFHRQGPIREWAIKAALLRGYFNILAGNAAISLSDKAVARSGSHCKHCTARHVCEAALAGGVGLYEAASKPSPLNISPAALSVLFNTVKRARKQLEALETGYEEQIKSLVRSGKQVPGMKVEATTGREQWSKPVNEVLALGRMLNKDLSKPGVITPNQARKLGIDAAVISVYSQTLQTGYKVVSDDGNQARHIFSNNQKAL